MDLFKYPNACCLLFYKHESDNTDENIVETNSKIMEEAQICCIFSSNQMLIVFKLVHRV